MIAVRAEIEALIPQQGDMCLLDGVEFCDGQRIICSTMLHRAMTNPLRTQGHLSSLHGIEFAAQAMAVHGGLTAPERDRPRVGLLLSARDCVFHRPRLDDIAGPLAVLAELLGNHEHTRLYRFRITAQDENVVDGRAAVMLRDGAWP